MKKDYIADRLHLIALYDLYGPLLSKTQQEAFEDHYLADLSLGEISEDRNTTRSAVGDALHKAEARLQEIESVLRFEETRKKLLSYLEEGSEESLTKAKELLEHGI